MSEHSHSAPKGEKLLFTEKVLGQYKLFYVDYKENKRGRFLKVTEKDGRFRSTIIIPEEALGEFTAVVTTVFKEHQAFLDSQPAEPDTSAEPDTPEPQEDSGQSYGPESPEPDPDNEPEKNTSDPGAETTRNGMLY